MAGGVTTYGAYRDPSVNVGRHEQAHTYQYQVLPTYFLGAKLLVQQATRLNLHQMSTAPIAEDGGNETDNFGRGFTCDDFFCGV
jgi:hypothetical protein